MYIYTKLKICHLFCALFSDYCKITLPPWAMRISTHYALRSLSLRIIGSSTCDAVATPIPSSRLLQVQLEYFSCIEQACLATTLWKRHASALIIHKFKSLDLKYTPEYARKTQKYSTEQGTWITCILLVRSYWNFEQSCFQYAAFCMFKLQVKTAIACLISTYTSFT